MENFIHKFEDFEEMSREDMTSGFGDHGEKRMKKRDRRYCSEYEEVEGAADIKEACFQTHKMEEEMSSGGTSGIIDKRPKDGRAAFAKHLMTRSVFKLAKEYVDSRGFLPKNFSTEIYLQNESRNRYTDVLCNDKTRVVLTNGNYVHANWVPIPNSMQRFICAQVCFFYTTSLWSVEILQ
uniref:Tyrosine-protein phosphatase domain-containing protein n=1 Tax=Panagrolaimus sp. ES5 TaxID=591445 RepID=A0AC34GBK7_9BILA